MDKVLKDFFISYRGFDQAWAEWIAYQLEEAGYSVIIQAWDFQPGSSFVNEMHKVLKEARRTIAVLSPDYFTSPYTTVEWQAAYKKDPMGEQGLLLPVRVRQCQVEGLLGPIVYIDLVDLDEAQAREKLFREVHRHDGDQPRRAKPAGAPGFPGSGKVQHSGIFLSGATPSSPGARNSSNNCGTTSPRRKQPPSSRLSAAWAASGKPRPPSSTPIGTTIPIAPSSG